MSILNFLNKLKSRGQMPLPQDVPNDAAVAPSGDAMIETAPMEVNTNISARPLAAIPSRAEFEAQNEQANLTQNAANSFTPLAVAPPNGMEAQPPSQPQPTTTPETSALAVNPYTQRRTQADEALANAQNKDWKGKDRDKDHNWWDSVKSGLLGAGMGFLRGGLGGAIVGGVSGGIHGAVDRNADEKFINNNFTLPRLQQAAEGAREAETGNLKAEGQQAQNDWYKIRPDIEKYKLGQANTKLNQKDRELDIRESTSKYTKLKGEKQQALAPIMKRGFYKKGLNEAEDAVLESLDIVLPDFDSRKREVKEQAGKFYQYDPDTQNWAEAQGVPTDESEVPVEFSVDGQRMMLRPRDVASIKSAELRQQSQQQFTATENEKNRQVRINLQDDKQEYDRLKKDGSPDSQQKVMRMKVNGRSAVKRGLMTEIEYQSLFGEPSTTEVTGTVGTGSIIQ